MAVVVSFLIMVCGIKIFLSSGKSQMLWFLGSLLLVNSSLVLTVSPRISSHFFFTICYITSLFYRKQLRWNKVPFKIIWLIYLLGFLLIAVNSQHLQGFSMIYKPFRDYIGTYFVLLIGFSASKHFNLDKNLLVVLFVVVIYGFFTALVRNDPLREMLPINFNYGYFFGNRLRIASTWSHPIAYGFVCSVFLISMLGNIGKSHQKIILSVFLLISVLVCGSRTALISLSVMYCVYVLMMGSKKTWKTSFCLLLLVGSVMLAIPSVTAKLDGVIDVFFGGKSVTGSSLEMRQEQLDGALVLGSQFPIYGGGFDYIQEVLGYGKDVDWKYWKQYGNLYGFESYLFILLIERGTCGIFIELMMALSLYAWIIRRRNRNREGSSKAVALLSGFYVFAFMTGTLDTWPIGMIFVGIYMGKLDDFVEEKQEKKSEKTIGYSNSRLQR